LFDVVTKKHPAVSTLKKRDLTAGRLLPSHMADKFDWDEFTPEPNSVNNPSQTFPPHVRPRRRIAAFMAWWHGLLVDIGTAVWS
jgi:hypothetical protein